MKKILAIAISAVMLICIMATSVFAIPEPWKLSEYGQEIIYLGTEADVAPALDGVVSAGEYAVEIKDMKLSDDDNDDRFFVVDNPTDIDSFNVYLSYDYDFIYLAVELHDNKLETGDGMVISLGLNDNIDEAIAFRSRHNLPGDPVDATPMNLWFYGKDLATEPDGNFCPFCALKPISPLSNLPPKRSEIDTRKRYSITDAERPVEYELRIKNNGLSERSLVHFITKS